MAHNDNNKVDNTNTEHRAFEKLTLSILKAFIPM